MSGYYAGRFSERWDAERWAVFSPAGVRVREFADDSRESGIAAHALADKLNAEAAQASR